ncbi:MAG: hypothetical protein AVDCRST_MAG43-280 [uncultured Thermomicrobiales bacterium]|uniref:Uncharacterized protein n=1 Tax=uncultured Thermomicrobiales bacterium TaxID=1645740 RepID=A0A6J4U7B9_9BACT|nr:MAG: hypothetical protein AVDCRST_MAG43-280 [uncultured Thermomicrobiales bacterium]
MGSLPSSEMAFPRNLGLPSDWRTRRMSSLGHVVGLHGIVGEAVEGAELVAERPEQAKSRSV